MDWFCLRPVRHDLTMLVVDLRNSSAFLLNSPAGEVAQFIREFSQLVSDIVLAVTEGEETEFHIDKFTGDGFLILFDEPTPNAVVKIGPARALVAARRMRDGLRQLIESWPGELTARDDFARLGLVAGITHGNVLYGPLTRPATHAPAVLMEPVVRAFRFAQVRGHRSLVHPDCILLCHDTRREVLGLRNGEELDEHPLLVDDVARVTLRETGRLNLKGSRDQTAFQALWPDDPSPPAETTAS